MTLKELKQAENLRDDIHRAEVYLRYITDYEHNHFRYGMKIVVPNGMFGTNNEILLFDTELKKDLLNTIKIHLVQKIQKAQKELEQL